MDDGDDDASVSENAQNQPEPSMFGDSQPDNLAPQVVSASEHSQHPFFAGGRASSVSRARAGGGSRGRGRGQQRGGGRGGNGSTSAAENVQSESNTAMIVPDSEERPLFGPISLKELEFAHRRNADGAESAMWSDDDDEDDGTVRKKKKRKNKARPNDTAKSRPRPRLDANDEDAMAAAAFGGGGEEEDDEDCEDDEDDDEYGEGEGGADDRSEARESSIAEGGSRLLPIRGETCVGCVCDRSVIQTVDAFVRQNAVCMTETALYKAAALHYRNEVVIPRRREGVRVLPWNWKDLQAHYVLHVCDPLLQRAAAVRSLGAVRAVQEQQLMRHNSDGTKQLDHKGAELLLKIVALQDKQILALDQARMPPPLARTGGGGR